MRRKAFEFIKANFLTGQRDARNSRSLILLHVTRVSLSRGVGGGTARLA